jgi:hypothetical protein
MQPLDLQTGDVLLFERGSKRGSFMGRIIRLVTGSKYTHCAMIVMQGREPLVFEQDGKVTLVPLRTHGFDEPVSVWRNIGVTWHKDAFTVASQLIGQPYGYANLLECLWSHTVNRYNILLPCPMVLEACRPRVTCAGLIANMLRACAVNVPYFAHVSTVAEPDDFSTNGYAQIGVLND